jgi:DNA recombination protein RmuC
MSSQLLAVLALAALVVAAFAVVLALRAQADRRQASEAAASAEAVLRQLDRTSLELNARLDGVAGEMNRTFSHALQQSTQTLAGSIGTVREETRAAIQERFVQVTERLGDLKATNDRIMEFSRSLDQFQRVLQSPKLRGDFGEFTLEQMLADLVPAEQYQTQAPVGGARVDAMIRTPHGALCIDAKFPLDNFRRALDAADTPARDAALKLFYADVRARVDEIAQRYIVPPETLEMAFMFVPAENVYYELLARPELVEYARSRRVVPVSPNTMYAYLQALAVGFRGMKIQQEARRVEQMLGDLRGRFERFHEHFLKVGRHLDNAQTQFQGAVRDVERFRATLQGFKVGQLEEIRDPAAERQPGDEPDPSV